MANAKLLELLSRHGEYNIVGHVRPDGDCVGSQLAIYDILRAKNIGCNIVKNDNYGHILSLFFAGYQLRSCENFNEKLPLICVDCSDCKRVGPEIFSKCHKPYLNIDHHISNDGFAENNIIDATSSSTAQMIASMLLSEGVDFGEGIARALYLGIMTDTNRFAYDTATVDTIKIVETLMGKGVSISEMYRAVYERDGMQKYRLLEKFLHNMTVFAGGSCCTSFVTDVDFAETDSDPLDTEGFVNYTRQIDGVRVGAFLEMHASYTKCSLRSKSADFRMDLFAKRFGGGGHPAAAGFVVDGGNGNFYAEFRKLLAEHVEGLSDG
ncbi:MAG: DHH family phosphoesterase [Puniceicoccales bacterium]|jgi:phosphoesterase RecJ-like protein|nr:DHH family phosphoesterase [Puniceicoccales bacterium]